MYERITCQDDYNHFFGQPVYPNIRTPGPLFQTSEV